MAGDKNWKEQIQDELQGRRLALGALSGGVGGLTEVFFAISFASLIFSGPLASNLPLGIGAALFSGAVIIIVSSLINSAPGMIASVQDSTTVILALIAANLTAGFPGPDGALGTVLAGIGIATLLSGVTMLALGYFKLGRLVRYIPYPVVGGFLAGTGLLLVQGSIGVMADYELTWQNLGALLQPGQLALWLPGVVCALTLFSGLRKIKHWLAMPALLLGLIGAFYLGLLISGISLTEARQMGLLMEGMSEIRWQPLSPAVLAAVDWRLLLRQSGNLGGLLVISLVSLLLNATGLEVVMGKEANLDRELRASGLANVLSGLGGGLVGYHAASLTTLNLRIGGRGRLPGVVTGLVPALTLIGGAALLSYFPTPLAGGFLLMVGLDFLDEWILQGRRRFTPVEYAVVLVIMGAIFFTDFLIGVGLGLAIMIAIFVVRYSQVEVVEYMLDGSQIRSNIERPAVQRRALARQGGRILILKLGGYIFFGTAHKMLEQARARLSDPNRPAVGYLLLDLQRVSGMDSSAGLSFGKIVQLAEEGGMALAWSGAGEGLQRRLDAMFEELASRLPRFPDLDRGLEWCEEQLLEELGLEAAAPAAGLREQLAQLGMATAAAERLMAFLERAPLEAGEYLMRQGEPADEMFFIESGRVSVYLEKAGGAASRLRTLNPGSTAGEVGLYLGQPRTASVRADRPSMAYRLSRESLQRLEGEAPETAAAFHALMARLLSEVVTMTTQALEVVLR